VSPPFLCRMLLQIALVMGAATLASTAALGQAAAPDPVQANMQAAAGR
jgi:hypothetical protein